MENHWLRQQFLLIFSKIILKMQDQALSAFFAFIIKSHIVKLVPNTEST